MKHPLIFKKNAELLKWGPIPGKYFYVYEFEEAVFRECVRKYKCESWPKALLMFNREKFIWINDLSEMQSIGKRIFVKFVLPEGKRRTLRKDWIKKVKNLTSFERKINKKFLESLSNEKLNSFYDEFYRAIIDFWAPTIPSELGNYGSDKFLEDKLKKIIKNKNDLSSAMEILTAPETISFYQKKEIILKYKLPKEIVNIAKAICEGINWQDERKKHIFTYIHYKDLFLKDMARRYNLPVKVLEDYSFHEIIRMKNTNNLTKRKENIVGFIVDTQIKELSEKESVYPLNF